jgi:hypothetical protein
VKRSNFLVTWTGKDIDPSGLTDSGRRRYVERLKDILAHGLWMTDPSERITGNTDCHVKYEAAMTCFTEVRLSQARNHAARYGSLGIAVERKFVLDRFGGPVHYVRNSSSGECVIGNAQEVLSFLKVHAPKAVQEYFAINSAFLKSMSNRDSDDFAYIDEHEWRIVHTFEMVGRGKIKTTGQARPQFRIPLEHSDIKLIVVPDSATLDLMLADSAIVDFFSKAGRPPIYLTLDECEQF